MDGMECDSVAVQGMAQLYLECGGRCRLPILTRSAYGLGRRELHR